MKKGKSSSKTERHMEMGRMKKEKGKKNTLERHHNNQ